MTYPLELISRVTNCINTLFDNVKHAVTRSMGIVDPITIMPYRGYGTPDWLKIMGRVLQDEGIKIQEENAPLWENIVNMYRRFESDEVSGARVQVSFGEFQHEVVTDEEGFYSIELPVPSISNEVDLWQTVDLKLLSPSVEDSPPIETQGEAIVIRDRAKFGVISDIDDTIMHTAATDLLKMIRIAYMGNEYTRRPFPGVSDFYHALQSGSSGSEGNPIFYVSSSAWNMYDLFIKFMDLNRVPAGPLMLKDAELSLDNIFRFDHEIHKREQIDPILNRLSHLPFILIGDSGQKDAEIYRRIVLDFPGRIKAVYIRNVSPNNPSRLQQLEAIANEIKQAGSQFILFSETQAAADHAALQGWIDPSFRVQKTE